MELVVGQQRGIRSADNEGRWSVPPWEAGASLCTVVRHFLRFQPHDTTGTAEKLAYYQGYRTAIEAAPETRADASMRPVVVPRPARLRWPLRSSVP